MAKYHRYIFDEEKRSFVGEFEQMYVKEHEEGFDAWSQEDPRQLNRRISLELLNSYQFESILDLGCGKGVITCHLKKLNNYVHGIDISATATGVAKSRFPDILFSICDINNLDELERIIASDEFLSRQNIELVFTAECLSYLPNWRELIHRLSFVSEYMLITLYIPPNPIGFVKSPEDLEKAFQLYFDVIESISLNKSRFIVLFGKSLSCTKG